MSEESKLFMTKIPKVMQQWSHPAVAFPDVKWEIWKSITQKQRK